MWSDAIRRPTTIWRACKEWSLTGGAERRTRTANEPARESSRRASPRCRSMRPIRQRSAWVAANAGSGKTHVLAQRVIRLLLAGVDPARILCITFTKAAAANMANRVFDDAAANGRCSTTPRSTQAMRDDRRQDGSTPRCAAGAAAVRAGAGDAGRTEGPDHPRLLHPAAASVSVRGQRRGAFRACSTRPSETQLLEQISLRRAARRPPTIRTARSAVRWRKP